MKVSHALDEPHAIDVHKAVQVAGRESLTQAHPDELVLRRLVPEHDLAKPDPPGLPRLNSSRDFSDFTLTRFPKRSLGLRGYQEIEGCDLGTLDSIPHLLDSVGNCPRPVPPAQ